MTVVLMEAVVSSFVTAPDLCSDWVRGPEESLVSDLEKTSIRVELSGIGRGLGAGSSDLRSAKCCGKCVAHQRVGCVVESHLSPERCACSVGGSSVDSPRRSGSRSWLRSGGGGVLHRGVLLGTALTRVLPVATSAEERADAGASALRLVEGCRGQWLGSSQSTFGLVGSRAEVLARPVLVQVRKSANVGGDRDLLHGLTLPRWSTTPSLILVVPRDMAESYGGRAAIAAWGEGMTRDTILMGVELGSVVSDRLHLGYHIGCRPGPSG
ncbi:hypothetical protein B296_00006336 [Ensete ventricosum]|uniref:Uncharacterized protein n=1 Tax=Ensete ventricosum TaxID=4639 RepID=A0A427AFZ5_ENSVE|nr:hypothetical protein B296_00006336 [Ensete ventricosum]